GATGPTSRAGAPARRAGTAGPARVPGRPDALRRRSPGPWQARGPAKPTEDQACSPSTHGTPGRHSRPPTGTVRTATPERGGRRPGADLPHPLRLPPGRAARRRPALPAADQHDPGHGLIPDHPAAAERHAGAAHPDTPGADRLPRVTNGARQAGTPARHAGAGATALP